MPPATPFSGGASVRAPRAPARGAGPRPVRFRSIAPPAVPAQRPGARPSRVASGPVVRPAGVQFPTAAPQVAPQTIPPAPSTTPKPTGSPLDATYYANLAANQLKVGNQIAADNAQIGNLGVSLQSALAQLAYQQPRDQLALEQKANARGALYSSGYDQQLGDLNNTYLTKQTGDTADEAQKVGVLQTDISNLQAGIPIYNSQQYAAAVARAAKLAATNPALGAPLPPTPTASAASAIAPKELKARPGQPATTTGMNPATILAGHPRPEKRSSSRQRHVTAVARHQSAKKKGRRG